MLKGRVLDRLIRHYKPVIYRRAVSDWNDQTKDAQSESPSPHDKGLEGLGCY